MWALGVSGVDDDVDDDYSDITVGIISNGDDDDDDNDDLGMTMIMMTTMTMMMMM